MSTPRHSRIIHSAWFQGADAAPPIVTYNFKRWAYLNPGYEFNIIDQAGAEELLRDTGIDLQGVSPQALSDMVRLRLLVEHGGVWADASLLPILPLDEWLPEKTDRSGFFALSRPWPHVIIASWFLAAERRHPIVRQWWDETCRYWDRPRRFIPGEPPIPAQSIDPNIDEWRDAYPYNWVQYLLEHKVGRTGSVQDALQGSSYMCGTRGRRLREALTEGSRDLDHLRSRAAMAPIQKLDWRVDWPIDMIDHVVSNL